MDAIDAKLDGRLSYFIKQCSWAFKLICDFNNCASVESDKFIPKLIEAGIVKSEIDFYDLYFKTKDCFDARILTGGTRRFLGVHPENYKFDPESIRKIDEKYK